MVTSDNNKNMTKGEVVLENPHPAFDLPNNVRDRSGKSSVYKNKVARILIAVSKSDQTALRQLAVSKHGLISDRLRRKAWPKILGVNSLNSSPKPDLKTIQSHHYYQQVVMDVNRSIRRFPPSIKEERRLNLQDQLICLIMRVLMKNPDLHYYQGYHDICITFLLVLGEEAAFHVVDKVSNYHLKDIMEKTMEKTNNLLQYLYVILNKVDDELSCHMEKSEVGVMFCLSWVMTWFGHVLENYNTVVRLFDFFLACKSLMPVYLSTAIVLIQRDAIMCTECDMAFMHAKLSAIHDDLPFEDLIDDASQLYIDYPPECLTEECENLIKLNAQKLAEEREQRLKVRNNLKSSNTCLPKFNIRGIHYWFRSQYVSPLGRWTVIIATGVALATTFYAVIYKYS